MTELWELSAEEIARRVRSREVSAAEVLEAAWRARRAVEPLMAAYLEIYEDEARARAAGIDRRIAAGEDPGPLAGVPVALKDNLNLEGRAGHLRLAHPRGLRRPLYRHRGGAAARGRRGDPGAGQHGRVRHGLVVRELGLPADPQPLGPGAACPAARAAARRRRWRRGACRSASARTPAARSASPPPSAAWWASSPPTAGCRATAWWPSPRRPTRSARWRATCATPPLGLQAIAGHGPARRDLRATRPVRRLSGGHRGRDRRPQGRGSCKEADGGRPGRRARRATGSESLERLAARRGRAGRGLGAQRARRRSRSIT